MLPWFFFVILSPLSPFLPFRSFHLLLSPSSDTSSSFQVPICLLSLLSCFLFFFFGFTTESFLSPLYVFGSIVKNYLPIYEGLVLSSQLFHWSICLFFLPVPCCYDYSHFTARNFLMTNHENCSRRTANSFV